MMKKISRLAALFAATALLFGAIGCSGEDEDPTPATPVDTVSPASFELTSSAEPVATVFTLTLGTTQINEAGLEALKANADLTAKKGDIVTQSEGNNIDVSAIKVAEDATANTVKLSVTMASTAAAGTKGTLSLTLPADFTANGEPIAKTISYEIKGSTTTPPPEEGGPENPSASATAKIYNFTGGENGIVAADISDWDLSAKDVINSPKATELTTKVLANGASISWKSSKVGTLRLRAEHAANTGAISDLAPTITALNYNGGANSDISDGIAIADLDRYVSIPVDGAGTVTAKVTFKGAKTSDNPTGGPFQVAFVDTEGKLLGTVVTDELTASSEKTVSGTITAAGTVYLAFSRNGAKKSDGNGTGGIDVSTITVAPAAN